MRQASLEPGMRVPVLRILPDRAASVVEGRGLLVAPVQGVPDLWTVIFQGENQIRRRFIPSFIGELGTPGFEARFEEFHAGLRHELTILPFPVSRQRGRARPASRPPAKKENV